MIFLDEIDALFGARVTTRESGGAIAHRGVITEFMQEMDGLKSLRDDNVIVIGATNRPFDLDDAVLRRLPRRLLVDLPGELEREGKYIIQFCHHTYSKVNVNLVCSEILKILLREEKLDADIDNRQLAKQTEGYSGSDLKRKSICTFI